VTVRPFTARQERERERDPDEPRRDVDPEDPAPAKHVDEKAAEGRADREARGLRRRLDPDRFSAPYRARRRDDDRDAVGLKQCRARRLQDAGRNEGAEARREAAGGASHDEDGETDRVEPRAAEDVGEPTEDRQQCRERQQIGERDPTDRDDGG